MSASDHVLFSLSHSGKLVEWTHGSSGSSTGSGSGTSPASGSSNNTEGSAGDGLPYASIFHDKVKLNWQVDKVRLQVEVGNSYRLDVNSYRPALTGRQVRLQVEDGNSYRPALAGRQVRLLVEFSLSIGRAIC